MKNAITSIGVDQNKKGARIDPEADIRGGEGTLHHPNLPLLRALHHPLVRPSLNPDQSPQDRSDLKRSL